MLVPDTPSSALSHPPSSSIVTVIIIINSLPVRESRLLSARHAYYTHSCLVLCLTFDTSVSRFLSHTAHTEIHSRAKLCLLHAYATHENTLSTLEPVDIPWNQFGKWGSDGVAFVRRWSEARRIARADAMSRIISKSKVLESFRNRMFSKVLNDLESLERFERLESIEVEHFDSPRLPIVPSYENIIFEMVK